MIICWINKFHTLEKELTLKYLRNGFTSKLLLLQINEVFRDINSAQFTHNLDRAIEDKICAVNSIKNCAREKAGKGFTFRQALSFADVYLLMFDNNFFVLRLSLKLHFYRDSWFTEKIKKAIDKKYD